MKRIGVIGGGASGLMAAIAAAKNGGLVTLYEQKSEAGSKILRTGNGKCNFSNEDMSGDYFQTDDPSFTAKILSRFGKEDLTNTFSGMGLLMKDKNGYLYPYSEQAKTIRDLLVSECKELGVTILTDSFVNCLSVCEDGSFLVSVEGKKERASFDRVIVAAGGRAGLLKKDRVNAYDLLEKLGLKVTPLYPGLTRLKTKSLFSESLDGVRMDAQVTLKVAGVEGESQYGEVLFRKDGISGICIFILSSFTGPALAKGQDVELILDLYPDLPREELSNYVKTCLVLNAGKSLRDFYKGLMPDKLAEELLRIRGLDPDQKAGEIPVDRLAALVTDCKEVPMTVTSTAGFEDAQVTVGGLETSELNEFCECIKVPGLYVTGELINTDGPCGGYNLQWAFSTGNIAGEHAACC